MLTHLHIENIAVIERADVEFSDGLSVLTGETGAGKSIIIDAISAVSGSRTNRDMIRTGATRALVTAVFEDAAGDAWCEENDVPSEDGEIVLQRVINADGRTACRINGAPVSVSQLRDISSVLLDLHGQSDSRQLLDEKKHLEYLDKYGYTGALAERYRESYDRYHAIVSEIERLRRSEAEKMQREDLLKLRIRELTDASVMPGETEALQAKRDLLRNAEKLTSHLRAALESLYEGQDDAVSMLGNAENSVDRAAAWDPTLRETGEQIRNARLEMENAAEEIRDRLEELDFSPEEFDRLESRLSLLKRLERKYGCDANGLNTLLERSRTELDDLQYSEEKLVSLEKDASAALSEAQKAARSLSDARRASGETLSRAVESELRELNMPSVRFVTEIRSSDAPEDLSPSGGDSVQFMISANAGEAPGPIVHVASGGELSRIMLALKNVFSDNEQIRTLIFDEIDTGVSGIAAMRVAEKLASLAVHKQVLCVTHLPQIAAMAKQQYSVEKAEREGKTYTEVLRLDREGRRKEIGRLTSGDALTDVILTGAEELLQKADSYRASLVKQHG